MKTNEPRRAQRSSTRRWWSTGLSIAVLAASASAWSSLGTALRGTVRDASGAPVEGAVVVASPLGADVELFPIAARGESKAKGAFELAVPAGSYSVSVLARGAQTSATLLPVAKAGGDALELAAVLADLQFAGVVTAADGTPAAGALVHVERREDGALLHAEAGADGSFSMLLPRGTWRAFAARGGARSEWLDRGPSEHRFTLVPASNDLLAPAPQAVVDELAKALVHGRDDGTIDVGALAKELAPARVVAIGDALRGTREEFAFGTQLFRALAEHHGHQLLALDAPFGDVWHLNTWVLEGKGDVEELVRGVKWGGWRGPELVELLRWMRAWNTDEKHARKLQLVGLDVMHTAASAALLTEFYPRADQVGGLRFSAWMGPFRSVNEKGMPPYERFDDESRESLRLMMVDLVGIFPDEHDNYVQYVSEDEYQVHHQHLRTLGACEEVLRLAGQGWTTRDRERLMPERLNWMLARCGEGAKAMVWARNSIAGVQGEAEFGSFGWWLRNEHGAGFTNLAVCVGKGRAMLPDGGVETKGYPPAAEFALDAPHVGSIESAFAPGKAGVLSIAKLGEKSPARAWLADERLRRSLESAWRGELGLYRRARLSEEFERLVWLPRATQ